MIINNLSQLKKVIKVGTKIIRVKSGISRKGIDEIRIVNKVQTNGIYIDGSWLEYQKSKDYEFYNNNEFSVYLPNEQHIEENLVGLYKILDN